MPTAIPDWPAPSRRRNRPQARSRARVCLVLASAVTSESPLACSRCPLNSIDVVQRTKPFRTIVGLARSAVKWMPRQRRARRAPPDYFPMNADRAIDIEPKNKDCLTSVVRCVVIPMRRRSILPTTRSPRRSRCRCGSPMILPKSPPDVLPRVDLHWGASGGPTPGQAAALLGLGVHDRFAANWSHVGRRAARRRELVAAPRGLSGQGPPVRPGGRAATSWCSASRPTAAGAI